VILRHIILHARRQKLGLIDLPGAKFLAHGCARNQTRALLTSLSLSETSSGWH
jgi:hypothetical protein